MGMVTPEDDDKVNSDMVSQYQRYIICPIFVKKSRYLG